MLKQLMLATILAITPAAYATGPYPILSYGECPDKVAESPTLLVTCNSVLAPLQKQFGPIKVNSTLRSIKQNHALGSKPTSQHLTGEALDIEIPDGDNKQLALWIRDNIKYDQLILENYTPGVPGSGWVHVSYTEQAARAEQLTMKVGPRGRKIYSYGIK